MLLKVIMHKFKKRILFLYNYIKLLYRKRQFYNNQYKNDIENIINIGKNNLLEQMFEERDISKTILNKYKTQYTYFIIFDENKQNLLSLVKYQQKNKINLFPRL
jgi:hypothetical protein